MSIRLSKKTSIMVAILLVLVVGGTGGYLLWRVNQDDTVAPGDSDAACIDKTNGAEYCNFASCQADSNYHKSCDGSGSKTCYGYFIGCQDGLYQCLECTPPASSTSCGDGSCNGNETLASCPKDCAKCGDGTCSSTESLTSCPGDCSVCGDGKCTGTESSSSCATDCACKAMTWTNKPTGTYTKSTTIPNVTVVSTNSTATTGVGVKLNNEALSVCPGASNCYSLSSDTASQTLTIKLFDGVTALTVGSYSLSVTFPGVSGSCVETTDFVVTDNQTNVVPDTGLFDGTLGKVYLGVGFVFLGVVTTQIPKFRYALNTFGEKNRVVMEVKRREKEEKRRNRFERRFE